MWGVEARCAHVGAAVVAHDQGLIGIPWVIQRNEIVPARPSMAGRPRRLTTGLMVV